MSREELIEKMRKAFEAKACQRIDKGHVPCSEGMAAALDVAVGELLGEPTFRELGGAVIGENNYVVPANALSNWVESRRSRYLKPKSDPAVDAAYGTLRKEYNYPHPDGQDSKALLSIAEKIVAAVRNADKSLA